MKSKIVYAEDNVDVREIFVLKIQMISDMEIVEMSCGNDAIEYIDENQDEIACVISDMNMDNGSGKDIYHFLYKKKIHIPFILISGEHTSIIKEFTEFNSYNSFNKVIDKPPGEGELEKALSFVDSLDVQKLHIMDNSFIPFRLNLLTHGNISPEDIYLRMGPDKYIHLYRKGDKLTKEDILKYRDRDVQFVYVMKEVFESFVQKYMVVMSNLIKQEEKGVSGEKVSVHYKVHELVHKQLLNAGLTPEVMQVTKKAVDACITTIQNEPHLAKLMLKLVNKGDWLYEHSLMLSFLSSLILEKLEWSSKDTLYKVNIAALFNDIAISDGAMAKELELKFANANPDLIKAEDSQYYDHSIDSAQYIENFREIPPDSYSIIAQGHERPDGSGFPRGLQGTRTFPLACVVNTAHAFLNEMYSRGFSQKAAIEAVRKMEDTYHNGHYDKPFTELKKIFKIV